MKTIILSARLLIAVLLAAAGVMSQTHAQGTAFTYQGRLNQNGAPTDGTYDFRFRTASDPFANNYVGTTFLTNGVPVSKGLFTVTIDVGNVFNGQSLYLETSVRTNGAGAYTTLAPLQPMTPTPYAVSAENFSGAVTSSQLSGTYAGAVNFSNANNSFAGSFNGNGTGLSNVNAATLNGVASVSFWQLGGNNVAAGQFLGSTNAQALELRAGGLRGLRIEPTANGYSNTLNYIAGSPNNYVPPFVSGATIGGGGTVFDGFSATNSVFGDFGTVGGGWGNTAGATFATIAGGNGNSASNTATVGGGAVNGALGNYSTVGGGQFNFAGADYAAIGGGYWNEAYGTNATIGGGTQNNAYGQGATVGGGFVNQAPGDYATIPGGNDNIASGKFTFAAGLGAVAQNDRTFVWSDGSNGLFQSAKNNAFLIHASGGVGIGTASPSRELEVQSAGDTEIGMKSTDTNGHLWTIQSSGITSNSFIDASFQIIDRTFGVSRLLIATNGNVGIGTRFPGSTLDVNGTVNANALSTATIENLTGPIDIMAGGSRAIHIDTSFAPNITGGAASNNITGGVGSVISGGGQAAQPNAITNSAYATIAGGEGNAITGGGGGTIAGGISCVLSNSTECSVVGGFVNQVLSQFASILGGGYGNQIGATNVGLALTGVSNQFNVITGGGANFILLNAGGSSIGGGENNSISNATQTFGATIPGGFFNAANGNYSFAAGFNARALHDGSFVWADSPNLSSGVPFSSTGSNQFLIRATGGVGINTNSPQAALHVVDSSAGTPAPNPNSIAIFEKAGNGYLSILTPNANENGIVFGNTNRTTDGGIIYNTSAARSGMEFRTGSNITQMTITSAGNVGIGTSTPSSEVEVRNTSDVELGLWSQDAGGHRWTLQSSGVNGSLLDASFQIIDRTSGVNTSRFLISTNGNVGIGTNSPNEKLTVHGNIIASGSICANNGVSCASDRNLKENFKPVNAREVLEKVAKLSVTQWNYKSDKESPHVGPVAQDFHAAFGLGHDNVTISTIDEGGVALAAIKGLNEKLAEKDAKISELEKRLAAVEAMMQRK